MPNTSQFDASASMLGYIYQIRYSLYLSLKKLSDLPDPEQFNVSIEKLDDIAFDNDGSPEELLQTKFPMVTKVTLPIEAPISGKPLGFG